MTILFAMNSSLSFEKTIVACRHALGAAGFGVLEAFDFQAAMREERDANIGPYVVLAACDPYSAREALQAVPEVDVIVPYNIAIFERGDRVFVQAIGPQPTFTIPIQSKIDAIANEIGNKLYIVLDEVAALCA